MFVLCSLGVASNEFDIPRYAFRKLGLMKHPDLKLTDLAAKRDRRKGFLKQAVRVLYRCDMLTPAQDFTGAKKHNERHHQAEDNRDKKFMETQPVSYRSVVAHALVCHPRDVVEEGQMVTLPRSALGSDLRSLEYSLAKRNFRNPINAPVVLDKDFELEHRPDVIVAKLVMKHPGNMKLVMQRRIAGGRIDKDSMLMTLHCVPFDADQADAMTVSALRTGEVVVFKRFAHSAGPPFIVITKCLCVRGAWGVVGGCFPEQSRGTRARERRSPSKSRVN